MKKDFLNHVGSREPASGTTHPAARLRTRLGLALVVLALGLSLAFPGLAAAGTQLLITPWYKKSLLFGGRPITLPVTGLRPAASP
jgi:hypothetical protein